MITLDYYVVAFIDLLGFSEMVRQDCRSARETTSFVDALYQSHVDGRALLSKDTECNVQQFSDSVVLSRPLDFGAIPSFLELVGAYQRLLLKHKVLCRGGVAMGKHFQKETFLYSDALIQAYSIESKTARYPRIVVSEAVLDRLEDLSVDVSDIVLLADDNANFVDYLNDNFGDQSEVEEAIRELLNQPIATPSVRDKLLWLAKYSDHSLGTHLRTPAFQTRA